MYKFLVLKHRHKAVKCTAEKGQGSFISRHYCVHVTEKAMRGFFLVYNRRRSLVVAVASGAGLSETLLCSTVRDGGGGGGSRSSSDSNSSRSGGGDGSGGGGSGGRGAEYETIKTRHTLRNNLLRDFMRLRMRSCSVASEERTSYCRRNGEGPKSEKSESPNVMIGKRGGGALMTVR